MQVSKCIGVMASVMSAFDSENAMKCPNDFHVQASHTEVKIVTKELLTYNVFESENTNAHQSFKKPKDLVYPTD